jgi:hypothetical protein
MHHCLFSLLVIVFLCLLHSLSFKFLFLQSFCYQLSNLFSFIVLSFIYRFVQFHLCAHCRQRHSEAVRWIGRRESTYSVIYQSCVSVISYLGFFHFSFCHSLTLFLHCRIPKEIATESSILHVHWFCFFSHICHSLLSFLSFSLALSFFDLVSVLHSFPCHF